MKEKTERKNRHRDEQIVITVTQKEKEMLQNAAYNDDMTFSAWARGVLIKKINGREEK